jgi:hypothetical protein
MEDWERRHDESWVNRWIRLTGNAPVDMTKLKACKKINGSALGLRPTIHDDALSLASQQFKQRKNYE